MCEALLGKAVDSELLQLRQNCVGAYKACPNCLAVIQLESGCNAMVGDAAAGAPTCPTLSLPPLGEHRLRLRFLLSL